MRKFFSTLLLLSSFSFFSAISYAQDSTKVIGLISSMEAPPPGVMEVEGITFWMKGKRYLIYAYGLPNSIGWRNWKQVISAYKAKKPVCLVGLTQDTGQPIQVDRAFSQNCSSNDF
jgi:hypothetical protein